MSKTAKNNSFSAQKSPEKFTNKVFQTEFIYDLLTEQEHCRKHKSKQSLTKLIYFYRKLVEHYSQRNDNIRHYFQQKISQASMEIATLDEPDEKITMSMTRQFMQQQQNMVDPRFKSVITTPIRYDPQIKKKERSKNAQIAIKINKIKKRANARTILKSYYDQCLQNNAIINQDLQNQRKFLQEKLMTIRNNLL